MLPTVQAVHMTKLPGRIPSMAPAIMFRGDVDMTAETVENRIEINNTMEAVAESKLAIQV